MSITVRGLQLFWWHLPVTLISPSFLLLILFSMADKALKRQGVSFLLETKDHVFQFNTMTPRAFCRKHIFGHFGDFQPTNGPN